MCQKLSINQSSCAKSLRGSRSYKEGASNNTYGGSYKKLQDAVEADTKIQEILRKIAEIREEKW